MQNEDENNQNNKSPEELRRMEIAARGGEAAAIKLVAMKAMREISNPNSKWNLLQELFQEICAVHIVKNPDKLPTTPQLKEELIREIELRYEHEPEIKKILLDSVPNDVRFLRNWTKKEGWKEAVWNKIKVAGLFTEEKRAQVIEALRMRAVTKDTNAAKLWLQLSGDLKEESVGGLDRAQDFYREINKILHSKKE